MMRKSLITAILLLAFTFSNCSLSAGQLSQNDEQIVIESVKEVTSKHNFNDFRLASSTPAKSTPFVICGSNESETIVKLNLLAGVPIKKIEQKLRRPDSGEPLLTKSESLLKRMALDNEVVNKHGFTHQQLAALLLIFDQLHKEDLQQTGTIGFGTWFHSLNQSKANIDASPLLGPFSKNNRGRMITIGRGYRKIRKKLTYSTQIAESIYRYGFYGGEKCKYRISPEELIEFFSPRILQMVPKPDAPAPSESGETKRAQLKITSNRTIELKQTIAHWNFDKPEKDFQTEFVLNGSNRTDWILKLPTIANRSIAELEQQMRPGAPGEGGSTEGFLGANESLLQVLANDNQLVLEKHGLTHQQLAAPLLILAQINSGKQNGIIKLGRNQFRVSNAVGFNGYQFSPFGDELKTSSEITIYHPQSRKKLHFSTLVPQLIFRYGFYEGLGTPYRVPPEKIIDFFGEEMLKSIKLN